MRAAALKPFFKSHLLGGVMVYRLDITARLHRRMLEIVGTALPLITSSRADADLVGLGHLREEMVQAMDAYCHHVHQLRNMGLVAANDADTLVAGCTDLRSAYEAFRARWVHRDGIENWYEYRLSAVVMMKQVRALVQHAERLGVATPRRAA